MQLTDENLIEYLLGDASPELISVIEKQLKVDPSLPDRLNHFRFVLGQVDSLSGAYEPPGDLVDNTMARIDAVASEEKVEPASRNALSAAHTSGKNRVTFLDSSALVLSLCVICCLALPGLLQIRFASRKNLCAENLRVFGRNFSQYSASDPAGRIPSVPASGPLSFAGIFSMELRDFGVDITPSDLACPSLNGSPLGRPIRMLATIPTTAEFKTSPAMSQLRYREGAGGNYAYVFGILQDDKLVAPRNEGRSHFALLADAPVIVEDQEVFAAHDGRGANVLYEDGRVFFRNISQLEGDYPFRNDLGQLSAGLADDDSCLGPSHHSPLYRGTWLFFK